MLPREDATTRKSQQTIKKSKVTNHAIGLTGSSPTKFAHTNRIWPCD